MTKSQRYVTTQNNTQRRETPATHGKMWRWNDWWCKHIFTRKSGMRNERAGNLPGRGRCFGTGKLSFYCPMTDERVLKHSKSQAFGITEADRVEFAKAFANTVDGELKCGMLASRDLSTHTKSLCVLSQREKLCKRQIVHCRRSYMLLCTKERPF